jgi:hypothetical protein
MYHTIEFSSSIHADVAVPGRKRLERLFIQKGTRLRVEIRPYVLESDRGPVEVADLFLEDGCEARTVDFASFHFLEREDCTGKAAQS